MTVLHCKADPHGLNNPTAALVPTDPPGTPRAIFLPNRCAVGKKPRHAQRLDWELGTDAAMLTYLLNTSARLTAPRGFSHARRKQCADCCASTEHRPLPVAVEDTFDDDRARIHRQAHRGRGSGNSPPDRGIELAHGRRGELARMAGEPRRALQS